MKITRSLIPKREERPKKKKEKCITTNFEKLKPENTILKNIIQKNSSLKNLKEKIQKESDNNIHEIFSSDETRLKAIKYVINASKGKENQKNSINQNKRNNVKIKKNLSFVAGYIPVPDNSKNKITVKRSQKAIYTKIDKMSPIKNENNKNKFFKEDKPINDNNLLRNNNIISNKKEKKKLYDSPSTIMTRNKSYEITSQREVNLQYIQPRNNYNFNNNNQNNMYINNNTQNNFYENKSFYNDINPVIKNNTFYNKINYIKRGNENFRNPYFDYNYQKTLITDVNSRNKTLNRFYIHKQINKSALYDNNNIIKNNSINRYNNNQEAKFVYIDQNKSNSYDINYDCNYNYIDNYNHRKNISQDGYYNDLLVQNYENKNPYYMTDANNFYHPKINNRFNYLNNLSKMRYIENNNKKKRIIRIMNNSNDNQTLQGSDSNSATNLYPQKIERNRPLKKKNNSFFINHAIPLSINQVNRREYNDKEYNTGIIQTVGNTTYNNNFSFHKKLLTNINYKGVLTSNDNNINNNENKENISNNRILVKKRPLKESSTTDLLNINSKINQKNKNYKLSISPNTILNYLSKNKNINKIMFNNEEEIIDYISNKFEKNKKSDTDKKLKYTGFILTKKYKGKILHEIRIEENINKINQKLKDEKIHIGNDQIQITTVNYNEELDNLKNIIINLEKDLTKLKIENESISKKDFLKNGLIKKLDKEKQNLIEENEKLNKELEKIKKLNDNLDKELKLLTNKNKMENIIKNYKIENILSLNINNASKIETNDNKKLKEEKVEVINTPKSKHNSNNLSINLNGSNGEVGVDSKKSNPFSVFRLSKVSEIKEIKTDNVDSGDKELKNNLELLNEKCNNGLKDGNQDIGEVNSFNENEDD